MARTLPCVLEVLAVDFIASSEERPELFIFFSSTSCKRHAQLFQSLGFTIECWVTEGDLGVRFYRYWGKGSK